MSWRPWATWTLAAALVAGAGVGGYAGVRSVRHHPAGAVQSSAALPPAGVLSDATRAPSASPSSTTPRPVRAKLAAALRGPLRDARQGGRVLAEVRDTATDAVLFAQGGTSPAAPASTAKVATALAVLAVHKPTDRIATRVMAGAASGTVVLVGAGDPTLSAATPGHTPAYAGAARIADLAKALHGVKRVGVDGSRFAGVGVSPDWAPEDVPSDYAAPITAAMVDGGRDTPGATVRSTAPDLAAGRALAAALQVPAAQVSRAKAPSGARVLATVQSAPIGQLVTQMLQESDNVLAEALARQVALAEHQPASFAGAAAAVRTVLARLGVSIGTDLVDGSGLAARDRLSPDTLTRLMVLATHRTTVLDMLPVAAWSGTLADRYVGRSGPSAGAGVIRAKTGTLTGVSTLAGLVHDKDGRLLAFALMADRVGPSAADTTRAEAALDRIAGTLAQCGC